MANSSELTTNTSFFVVDDAPTSRELMVQNLKKLGFREVTEGASEGEALATLEEKSFDLIICQKNMRQMSGYEFLSEMRENMAIRATAFLLMGDSFSKEDQTQFSESIPDELLKTPVLLKEITLKLSQTLVKFYEKDNVYWHKDKDFYADICP